MTKFINFPAADAKANACARTRRSSGSAQLRRVKKDGAINCSYRIGSESPGREIGAITLGEIVTLGNLYVSGRAGTRLSQNSAPPARRARARALARVHHNNSPVIFIWSRFIARDGLWAAGTVCY